MLARHRVRTFSFLAALVACLVLFGCGGGGGGSGSGGGAGVGSSGNVVIPATTKVLGESAMQSSSVSADGNTLTFDKSAPGIQSVAPGNVVVSGVSASAPNGLIRKVSSVRQNNNQVIVDTVPATLEDAVQSGSFTFSKRLTLGDLLFASPLREGVYLSNPRLESQELEGFYVELRDVILYDGDGNLNTANDQIRANGGISLNPSFTFNMEIEDFRLKKLLFTNNTVVKAELELVVEASDVVEEKVEITRLTGTPLTIWMGFVPVVIVPVLSVNVGLKGEVSLGMSTSGTVEAALLAGLSYENGWWNPITDFSINFGYVPPSLSADFSAKVYAGPQLSLLLYGVAGPYGEVRGYLDLEADLFGNPWWELYGGVEADVGVRVEVLGHKITDYEIPLAIGYRKLLTHAEGPFVQPVPDDVPPSVPQNLTAQATSSSQISLSWTASTDNVRVAGYRIYRDGSPLKNVSNNSASDTGLPANTQYCYAVSAYDAAGNESDRSVRACAKTQAAASTSFVVKNYFPLSSGGFWEYTGGTTISSTYVSVPFITGKVYKFEISSGGEKISFFFNYDVSGNLIFQGGTTSSWFYILDNPAIFFPSQMQLNQTYSFTSQSKIYDSSNNLMGTITDQYTLSGSGPEQVSTGMGNFQTYKISITDQYQTGSYAGSENYVLWLAEGIGIAKLENNYSQTFTLQTKNSSSGQYVYSHSWAVGSYDDYGELAINPDGDKIYFRGRNQLGGDIKVFNSSGNLLKSFSYTGWGGGIGVDYYDKVYLGTYNVSTETALVKVYSDGAPIRQWNLALPYNPSDDFNQSMAVAVNNSSDPRIYVLVSDIQLAGARIVQQFDSNGKLIKSWQASEMLTFPVNMSLDYNNNIVFLLTYYPARVYRYSDDGTLINWWGNSTVNSSEDGKFSYPFGIANTAYGVVAVADTSNHRVQIFSSDGSFLQKISSLSTSQQQLSYPAAVALSPTGDRLYVLDDNGIHAYTKQ